MMRNVSKTVGALALVWAAASPANATIVFADYTGMVTDGYDPGGLFGPAGGSLAGLSFDAYYLFDTDLGSRTTDGSSDTVTGGGTPNPSLGATLTINGRSFHISGSTYGEDSLNADVDEAYAESGSDSSIQTFASGGGTPYATSLDTAFSIAVSPDSVSDGAFLREDLTYAYFSYATISGGPFIPGPAVPEPAAWALMLMGFGALGAAKRYRRRGTTIME